MNPKIETILKELITLDNVTITLDSHLKDDLGLDSLSLAVLTVEIEEEFGVDIFEEGIIFTVRDILQKLND